MRIHFLGAARQVTGSQYCLERDGKKILIDCGMYQERQFRDRNWNPHPIGPRNIDAVLVTHAHVDHCGLLPKLVKEGFSGPIYTTPASAELIEIILLDSAKVQAEDVAFKEKRHRKEGRRGPHPYRVLFTEDDVRRTLPLLEEVAYDTPTPLFSGISATFRDAGHILGSAMVDLQAETPDSARRVVFTGDLGQNRRPILRDPHLIERADYVVMESTYGDRTHEATEDTQTQLARVINDTLGRGGNIVIPTFAMERAQELIYQIGQLIGSGQIASVPVFLDSPMAQRVTRVFRRHPELYDEETNRRIASGDSPFRFPSLNMVSTTEDSKAINHEPRSSIIMSTSGMCTAGRIKHHLVHNIERSDSTIVFVGFQAKGTLGRILLEGAPHVRILGRERTVRAKIAQIRGFSGHADRDALLQWLAHLTQAPRRLFLTHGDASAAESLAREIRRRWGWEVLVPNYRQTVSIDDER